MESEEELGLESLYPETQSSLGHVELELASRPRELQ